MGGVDMDRQISLLVIHTDQEMDNACLCTFCFNMTTCNACILYICHCKPCEVPPKNRLQACNSRELKKKKKKLRGQKFVKTGKIAMKKNQQIVPLPVNDVWYGHFPKHVKQEKSNEVSFPRMP